MKKIRAKFEVVNTEDKGDSTVVTLMPVISGSKENESFWKNTPAGYISLTITNPDAVFESGEYYVDFTKADSQD